MHALYRDLDAALRELESADVSEVVDEDRLNALCSQVLALLVRVQPMSRTAHRALSRRAAVALAGVGDQLVPARAP